MNVDLILNGEKVSAQIDPATRLVDLLRETFEFTGTKVGCEEGECGACTVLVNGVAVNSCLYLAADADGTEVLTIEGLGAKGEVDQVIKTFVESGAVQCGFCTPGMIMRAYAFLKENDSPTKEEIKRSIEGNICRCTGYVKIIDAIETLADSGAGSRGD